MSQLSCGLGRGENLAAPVTLIAVGEERMHKSGPDGSVKIRMCEG
jgi:hypothetical protein